MASNDLLPAGFTSDGSARNREDDDSMASSNGETEDDRGPVSLQAKRLRRGFQMISSTGSDIFNVLKDGAGLRSEKLCTTCKRIPFAECLPGDAEEDDDPVDLNPG